MHVEAVFLFDLDGTLVDSVYQHVLAWKDALDHEGISLSVWRIHRRIGMSGGLFMNQLLRETGLEISPERLSKLGRLHAEAYRRHVEQVRPLPGARELLAALDAGGRRWDRHQRPDGDGRAKSEGARRRSSQDSGRDTRPGEVCQAGPGSVPGCGSTARGVHRNCRDHRRLHLGHACRAALPWPRRRIALRRLWPRGAGASGGGSRVRRPR